ncbi:MAG: AIPR family protein [Methylococcales bacterium]
MPELSKAMMQVLKATLSERFLSIIPPLQGNQNSEIKINKQISRAFNAFILQKLLDLPANDAANAVVDDFADNGIDAIYYNESDETLYLVQSKLKATEQFKQAEAEGFTRGVRLLVEQELVTFNDLVKNKSAYIENALDHCSFIKLVVAYTGSGITQPAKDSLQQLVDDQTLDESRISQEILYVSSNEIESFLREEKSIQPVNTRLKIRKSNEVETPRKTVFGLVKVSDLVELHKTYGKALYQKNIRYFIGAGKRGVNKAIKDTLENNPEDFLHLNNGVTIVCNKAEPKRTRAGYKDYKLTGMSVVNGAQTISSAHQFLDAFPEKDIALAQVMLTIVVASETDNFHKKVTKARNLQNPVSLGDFVALDDNQERLRQDLALHGYMYSYRPEILSNMTPNSININDAAKALACLNVDIRFPAKLKAEPSVFVQSEKEEYQAVFSDDLSPITLINAVVVFNVIKNVMKSNEQSSPSPEKLVYRHGVYVIASIIMKRLRVKITSDIKLTSQEIRTDISQPLDEIRYQCFEKYRTLMAGYAPHASFKRISDTAKLISQIMINYQNLDEDPAVQNMQRTYVPSDPHNQKLISYMAEKSVQI